MTRCTCAGAIVEALADTQALAAVNWECKLASWTEQCSMYPNICTYPVEDAGPAVT